MQKIRHFIKSIKELCYDMNRSLPKKLSLYIAFPLFLLYSLELISGYYHQFTVFSIVFICIELCSIVLFIQFPYTGSIIIIILWITAVSIKPVLPYSFVFAGLSATVILGYINIPSAISILLFATSILFFPTSYRQERTRHVRYYVLDPSHNRVRHSSPSESKTRHQSTDHPQMEGRNRRRAARHRMQRSYLRNPPNKPFKE